MKYQVGFKNFFYLRLLRSAYVTFLKIGCKYQNVITSGIYRTHYIYKIINPDTCQSQFTLSISMWDTLYCSYIVEFYEMCNLIVRDDFSFLRTFGLNILMKQNVHLQFELKLRGVEVSLGIFMCFWLNFDSFKMQNS